MLLHAFSLAWIFCLIVSALLWTILGVTGAGVSFNMQLGHAGFVMHVTTDGSPSGINVSRHMLHWYMLPTTFLHTYITTTCMPAHDIWHFNWGVVVSLTSETHKTCRLRISKLFCNAGLVIKAKPITSVPWTLLSASCSRFTRLTRFTPKPTCIHTNYGRVCRMWTLVCLDYFVKRRKFDTYVTCLKMLIDGCVFLNKQKSNVVFMV